MKTVHITFAVLAAVAICMSCDTKPAEQMTVSVSPQTSRVRVGDSVDLVASGAVTYEWALLHGSATDTNQIWGLLDKTTGDAVRYTCMRTPKYLSNKVQIVVVTGYAGGHDTNSATLSSTTEAYITHK